MRRPLLLPLALFALSTFAFSGRASAQTPVQTVPTAGMTLPAPSVATDFDATALSLNPAGLAMLPASSAVFVHTSGLRDAPTTLGGDGLFLSAPLLGPTAIGLAVEDIRPPPATALLPAYQNHVRVSLGGAIGSPRFALGVGWHHFIDRDAPATGLDESDAWDVGLSLRPSSYVGAGVVVRDFTSELVGGVPVDTTFVPELVLRPLGTGMLQISGGLRVGARHALPSPYARLTLEPFAGLRLLADVEDDELLLVSAGGGESTRRDLVATLGLAMSFDGLTVGGAYLGRNLSGPAGASAWIALSGAREPSLLPEDVVVRHKIDGDLDDRKLIGLLAALAEDERDPHVRGVVLEIGDVDTGWASIEELRDAVAAVRKAGKPVYAYITATETREYYLAAASDRIYLSPAGGIRLVGLSSTLLLLGDALAKIDVVPNFIKIGKYKSAPEEFTEAHSSGPAQEERNALLDDVYADLVQGIASGRGMTPDQARAVIDAGPYTAAEALGAKLVDKLATHDEFEAEVRERLGELPGDPDDRPEVHARWIRPTVAVVVIDGDIVQGRSSDLPIVGRLTGSDSIVRSLERIAREREVSAVVLRVNSPGGDALASDLIDQAVLKVEKRGIPVIASMGDVAASGGYYVLADAGLVFAEPATITGSIGIFSGKFDISGLLSRLGINTETYKRGEHADEDSLYRSYTDAERAQLLEKLHYFYDRFVDAVARGRHLEPAQVDALGQGRVWSGRRALDAKLVNRQGGYRAALEEAERQAGIPTGADVDVELLPPEPSLLQQLVSAATGEARATEPVELPSWLAAAVRAIPASLWITRGEPLARMPYDIRIE